MDLVAADIMTSPVISAHQDMPVRELTDLLQARHISGVPVVDSDDQLVGVVSITDIVALGSDTEDWPEAKDSDFHTSPAMDGMSRASDLLEPEADLLDHPIRDLMSRDVITALEETPVGKIADTMVTHRIHRVIIVTGDRAVGIVSVTDILRTLRDRYRARS